MPVSIAVGAVSDLEQVPAPNPTDAQFAQTVFSHKIRSALLNGSPCVEELQHAKAESQTP